MVEEGGGNGVGEGGGRILRIDRTRDGLGAVQSRSQQHGISARDGKPIIGLRDPVRLLISLVPLAKEP